MMSNVTKWSVFQNQVTYYSDRKLNTINMYASMQGYDSENWI